MLKPNNPFSLEGKLILITGASSGIGRECAIACSQAEATVVILGRDPARLKETLSLMDQPCKHIMYISDLLEFDKIEQIVKECVMQKGRIDGLINCAGISTTLPLNAISPEKTQHFFETNVSGPMNLTKHVIKISNFGLSGGSIIFISSIMGLAGENGKTLYSLTKGALISAVRSMAIELAKRKIRVNSVSPGVVDTPMSRSAVYSNDEDSFQRVLALHPLGLGKPEDVANACIFLLSDASRWITGTNLVLDGGYLAR